MGMAIGAKSAKRENLVFCVDAWQSCRGRLNL